MTLAAPVRRGGGVRRWAPAAYPVLLVVLTLVQVVLPQRSGPLALTEVFAPWLFLPVLFLLPFLLLRDPVVVGALALAALAFAVHLGPGLVPSRQPAVPAGSVPVRIASWNVYIRNPAARVVGTLRSLDADVVGLVELNPRQAERLAADPDLHARYPTVLLMPETSRGLLSRYPLIDSGVREDGSARSGSGLLWARLDLGSGRRLTVVVAHPLPAEASPSSALPLRWDARPRDAEIAYVKAFVDARLRAGERVVLMGDFNVTDREPANTTLSRGMRDAHDVAWGGGASWGPLTLRRHGLALVRIDRILGGPGTVPTASSTDCTFHGSDHCVLHATVAVGR